MRWLIVCAVLTFGLAPALADDAPTPTPEQAIKQGVKDLEAAWAKHDAKALADLYSPNAEIVTESGQTLAGRDGIQEALTQAFSDTLKDSTLSETVDKVRFIKPDVAIIDADAVVKSGDTEINKMHLVSVVMKQDGKWLVETTRAIAYKQQ